MVCLFNNRKLLAFIYIPVIQKQLDIFREKIWNSHRVRKQNGKELPTGVPEHIFTFPRNYGGDDYGCPVSEQQLEEVAEVSGVLIGTDDFLDAEERAEWEIIFPQIDEIEPADTANAYLFLKATLQERSNSIGN